MPEPATQPEDDGKPDEAEQEDTDMRQLRCACARLMEHFDTVQIFATRHCAENGTVNANYGEGNWYARFGQVGTWIAKQDQGNRNEVE